MSLLAIIIVAIVIPFVILTLGFIWFFIRSRIAKLSAPPKRRSYKSQLMSKDINKVTLKPKVEVGGYSPVHAKPIRDFKPTYKPLSHFLESADDVAVADGPDSEYASLSQLTIIPGVTEEIERELQNLGYHSVAQIARWGRADVRAVSSNLEMDQQVIEEEWIANARLILAIRSTSFTS